MSPRRDKSEWHLAIICLGLNGLDDSSDPPSRPARMCLAEGYSPDIALAISPAQRNLLIKRAG